MSQDNHAISAYFDGLCPLCSREIEHYKNLKGSKNIRFVDITNTKFQAAAEGVDPVRVHQHLHVKNQAGTLFTGIDAFIEIWRVLPRYHWLAKFAARKGVGPIFKLGYAAFAKIRPLLPRRSRDKCDESPYCDIKGKK